MSNAFLAGLLLALAIIVVFLAIYRLVPRQDPVEDRLRQYGMGQELSAADEDDPRRVRLPLLTRLITGFGVADKLALSLARADLPLTAAEYTLVILGAAGAGLAIGGLRGGLGVGLLLAPIFGLLPIFYLRIRINRRRQAMSRQLPDVVTLLAGSLRAGYGLNQAISLLVDQMQPPASKEFARVLNAVNLGYPMPKALSDMARRVGSDDLDLVVMAIVVQYEAGGNLAGILETIGHTVRERIRILREVSVLTAQQRLTGYVLAATPIFLAVFLVLRDPTYFDPFFRPGMIRVLPVAAVLMLTTAFVIIQRIISIRV